MYRAQQSFEPIQHFTVPWQKSRALMHMTTLMNLILFEPFRNMASREIASRTARTNINVIQLYESVYEEIPFFFIHSRNVPTNTIAESHRQESSLGLRNKF